MFNYKSNFIKNVYDTCVKKNRVRRNESGTRNSVTGNSAAIAVRRRPRHIFDTRRTDHARACVPTARDKQEAVTLVLYRQHNREKNNIPTTITTTTTASAIGSMLKKSQMGKRQKNLSYF